MNGEDAVPSRVRRMLPSVSEVLKELTARSPIEPDVAFRAAREVCAEELKRIRDAGGDSVPLDELVRRALVRATGGRTPVPSPPAVPLAPPPSPPAAPAEPAVEDPFSETTGAMDLRWDRDAREPFSEGAAAGPLPVGDGTPEPPGERVPVFVPPPTAPAPGEPEPFALPHPADAAVPAAAASPLEFPPEPVEGPGDETLSRLSREAESIDLKSVFPPGARAVTPAIPRPAANAGRIPRPEPPPAPFEDDEDTVLTIPRGGRTGRGGEDGPRFGLILGVAAGLVALAGLGYLLAGLWMERDVAPPPIAVTRPKRAATPAVAPTVAPATAAAEPSPAAGPAAAPSPAATAAPAVATVAPPSPTAAVAARTPPAAPSPAPRVPTSPAAVAKAVPTQSVAPPPAPVTAAGAVRQSRDGLVVTRDRAGQPQVFSIHFTSYSDRASAERDVKRVARLSGLEAWVAEVDLGEKGIWQRVMAGAFPTVAEAQAARAELAAKGTPDLGLVYRVVGPESGERR